MKGKYKKYNNGGKLPNPFSKKPYTRSERKEAMQDLRSAYGDETSVQSFIEKSINRLKDGKWHYDIECGWNGCEHKSHSEKMGALPLPLKIPLVTADFLRQEFPSGIYPMDWITYAYKPRIYKNDTPKKGKAINFRRDAKKLAEYRSLIQGIRENPEYTSSEPIYLDKKQFSERDAKKLANYEMMAENMLDRYKRIGER